MGQNQDPIAERDKFGMPEDTPDFNIDPDSGMTPPAEFPYNGHQVEILPPDTEHLIGKYWQIKIDGVIRGNFLFSSTRTAADEAIKLIDNVSTGKSWPRTGLNGSTFSAVICAARLRSAKSSDPTM
jgi:hypothetical protein